MVSAANARANAMKRIAMVKIVSANCEESMRTPSLRLTISKISFARQKGVNEAQR